MKYFVREREDGQRTRLIFSRASSGRASLRSLWEGYRRFIRALARGERRNPKHRLTASNRFALLRTGRVQADGRQECILKVLLHKRRGMRELVNRRMCLASERVDALEVEIAALCEVGERGIDE